MLLEHGADVSAKSNFDEAHRGATPLRVIAGTHIVECFWFAIIPQSAILNL